MHRYVNPRTRHFRLLLLMVAALSLVVTACSSSKSKGTDPSKPGSSAGGDASKAVALLAQYTTRPTTFSLTVPVGKPIPTGKTIAYINCGNTICASQGPILETAAKVLGWTVNTINTDGTPAQIQNAWAQVLRQKPDGVIYTSTPRAQINAQIHAVAAAGIPIAACCEADEAGDGIIYYSENKSAIAKEGPAIATWIAATSGGSGDAVFANTPEFPILSGIASTLKSSLAEQCSGCSLSELDLPLSSIGKNATDLIVSYLRTHPKTKYVALSTDLVGLGLPGMLKSAGLKDIKTIGNAPGTPTLQYIATGQQAASIIYPEYENMYAMLDALARKITGVPVQPAIDPPVFIGTQKNLPSSTTLFPVVPDLEAIFAKLWGKG